MNAQPLLLGVPPVLDVPVVEQAADLAERLGAALLCVHVDPSRYAVQQLEDGSVRSAPVDPDAGDERVERFPRATVQQLALLLGARELDWSTRALAGAPAQQLAAAAQAADAQLIVLGVRERSWAAALHELLNGSVAVQLAHRQPRPVLLVPSRPKNAAE